MDGLATPVTVVKSNAPKSSVFSPALCSARQSACSPNSCATLIQMSLAWPQVLMSTYCSAGIAR